MGKVLAFFGRAFTSLTVVALFVTPLVALVLTMLTGGEHKAEWLMVELTAIYALLTLMLAAAAFQSSKASQDAVAVMRDSVEEQRKARWSQFSAVVTFPEGQVYFAPPEHDPMIMFGNAYAQPITNFQAWLWHTEKNASGEPEMRYSSMLESEQTSISADRSQFRVVLRKGPATESECRNLGELALERFKDVFNGHPQNSLCLIRFNHRAELEPMWLVFDLKPAVQALPGLGIGELN